MGLGLGGIRRFRGNEMHIFYYAKGGDFLQVFVDQNGGERRSLV
jgi:hypothetical protein